MSAAPSDTRPRRHGLRWVGVLLVAVPLMGCQLDLAQRHDELTALGPQWTQFAPPLGPDEMLRDIARMPAVTTPTADGVLDVPSEIVVPAEGPAGATGRTEGAHPVPQSLDEVCRVPVPSGCMCPPGAGGTAPGMTDPGVEAPVDLRPIPDDPLSEGPIPDGPTPEGAAPEGLPALPGATPPGTVAEDDPWGPAPPSTGDPMPVDPAPAAPRDPGMEDDPWSRDGGSDAPPPSEPSGMPTEDDPWSSNPAGVEGDPLLGTDAGTSSSDPSAPGGRGDTREARVLEQVTRLTRRPGDPAVQGYPDDLLIKAPAWVALRSGPRPMVLIFHDDAVRTSDTLAAEMLPVLARYSKDVDVITIDRGPDHAPDEHETRVVKRYLVEDNDVPVLVVADGDRRTRLARFSWFPAAELEGVLRSCLGLAPAEAPVATAPPREPVDAHRPDRTTDTGRPAADPLADPLDLGVPPGMTPEPERPGRSLPNGSAPGGVSADGDSLPLTPRRDPLFSDPETGPRPAPQDPAAFRFNTPRAREAEAHARRLRDDPGNARLGGYPRSLVRRANPRLALDPGHRPVVIIFHDDASRASNLQAADILPVVVAHQQDVDWVVIDVSRAAERSDAENEVVKPHYPGSVPATIVLSTSRSPVRMRYRRTSAQWLEDGIREALRKR